MRVTFLGTSGAVPTTRRNPSAVFVNREGEEFLLDCGEGTQRQMMRYSTGFAVDHVFITHTHGDHVLGLPGLLETLDFNDRERPIAIHAPSGTRSAIERLIEVTGDRPSYPIRIDQVSAGDVVHAGDGYEVRAVATDHRCPAVGYAIVEDERKGRFDREKAEEELGVPPGPAYSKLHRGESVELDDERTIEPDQVVGPPRPGRTVVYSGDTRPTEAVVAASEDADLLIHDATFAEDRAERAAATGHSTAREAATVAREAGAKRLALTHLSTRYAGNPDVIAEEAREVYGGAVGGGVGSDASGSGHTGHSDAEVFVATDGQEIDVPYPDED